MSTSFQSLTSNVRPVKKGPLDRLHGWLRKSKPNAFDKPTRQEWTLSAVSILFAPIIMLFASIWVLFQPEFLKLSSVKRVFFILVLPFLLPAAYCYVVTVDVITPIVKRVRYRHKLLREAKRSVKDLMKRSNISTT